MHIAIITTGFAADENDYGGAAAILNLTKQLASYKDIEISVFALYYPAYQPQLTVAGMNVFTFAKSNPNDKIEKLRIWRECGKKFAEEHRLKPFDIVHAMWSGESGYVAAGIAKKFDLPMVANINGGELGELKEIKFGSRLTLFQKNFVNRSFEQAKVIAAGSDFILGLVKKYYGEKIYSKTKKLPFGVDTKMFTAGKKTFDPAKPVLINIANAVPVKSHITLFKALKLVLDKYPFVIVECYGRDDKNMLKSLAASAGVESNVKLNGFVEYEKIPEVLNKADVCVLSSLYESENMSVLEASFCGLPVVSSDVGIAREITPNVVTPGDPQKLAEKIIYVLDNYEKEKQKALLQHETLISKFSIKNVSIDFIDMYKEVIKPHSA